MNVILKSSMAGHNFSHAAGDEIDVPEDKARRMVDTGLAVLAEGEAFAGEKPAKRSRSRKPAVKKEETSGDETETDE